MILTLIRIVYLFVSIILIVHLFDNKNIYFKIAYAFVALPFIMRALLLK